MSEGRSKNNMWSWSAAAAIPVAWWIYCYATRPKPKLPYPPGPPGHWLWGNALQIPDVRKGESFETKYLEWSYEYGPIFTLKLPIVGRVIVIGDVDAAKYILITKNYPKSWTYKTLLPLIGERSIVVTHGDTWKKQRKAFNPGFTPLFLKDMVCIMSEKMERFLQCIDQDVASKKETNTLERSQTFTSDVVVQIAFGEDWGGDKIHPARLWLTEMLERVASIANNPFEQYFGFTTKRRVRELQHLLDEEMFAIVDRRLQSTSQGTNICSIAIDQLKEPDGTLTDDKKITVMHQLKTFYVAGHDTTASTIAWAIWLLSQHNDILQKVRAELISQNVTANPSYEQLQTCTYLEAVVKETLRLYPPAATIRSTSDVSETYGGYTIGGAVLYVSPYVLQRQESLWERASDFYPERWQEQDRFPPTFISFSRGPRDCLGKYFALLEIKIAVSAIVQRYEMECINPNDNFCYKVTQCPRDGARVRFTHRK